MCVYKQKCTENQIQISYSKELFKVYDKIYTHTQIERERGRESLMSSQFLAEFLYHRFQRYEQQPLWLSKLVLMLPLVSKGVSIMAVNSFYMTFYLSCTKDMKKQTYNNICWLFHVGTIRLQHMCLSQSFMFIFILPILYEH